jgi:membrane protein required for colicin V production
MNYLDFLLIIIVVISAIAGYNKGFIRQLASLAALVLGVFLAVKIGSIVYPFINKHFFSSVNVSKVVAFALIFIVVSIGIHLFGKFLEKTFEEVELGHLNKLTGMVFSVAKSVFIISILMVLVRFSVIHLNWPKQVDIEKSYFYKPCESVAPAIFPFFEINKESSNKSEYKN